MYSKYLNDPLDEIYRVQPGEWVEDGDLPEQDHQVRGALVTMKLATTKLIECSLFSRLLNSTKYKEIYNLALESQESLRKLVNSTPEHKAALRRIVNAMPLGNGGRETLQIYFD